MSVAEPAGVLLGPNMSEDKARELRRAFPANVIGKLPKKNKHTDEVILLDFVGHAAVTDRLLAVDPGWTWEPLALDAAGLPAVDPDGNMWIRLTVCGVTRLGVGDGFSAKERIGDAIRNAAMRFGVALELWTKNELELGGAEDAGASPEGFFTAIAAAAAVAELDDLVKDITAAPLTRADAAKVRAAWSARCAELEGAKE